MTASRSWLLYHPEGRGALRLRGQARIVAQACADAAADSGTEPHRPGAGDALWTIQNHGFVLTRENDRAGSCANQDGRVAVEIVQKDALCEACARAARTPKLGGKGWHQILEEYRGTIGAQVEDAAIEAGLPVGEASLKMARSYARAAESWFSCACGSMERGIRRNARTGEPLDETLRTLGLSFARAVRLGAPRLALGYLASIEERTALLLADRDALVPESLKRLLPKNPDQKTRGEKPE